MPRKRRSVKPSLSFPRRPYTRPHRIFGRVRRWTDKTKQFRVEQFIGGSGKFIAMRVLEGKTKLISSHQTLKAAQKACAKSVK